MTSLWHDGGVASAVAEVRAKGSLLVVHSVYVGAVDGDADMALKALCWASTRALEKHTFKSSALRGAVSRHKAVCVRLRATADDADYANFAALFTVTNTPCVHIIAPDGRVLLVREFFTSASALCRALDYAAAVRDNGNPTMPDLGPELHPPKPLPQHVLDELKAERAALEAEAKYRKEALEAKRKADEEAAKRAPVDVGTTTTTTTTTTPKPTSTATTTAKGVVERTSTVTRSLPESGGALQLGARARLQVRLPGGVSATRSFDSSATLGDVMEWACTEGGVEPGSLQLSVAFPRRVFDGGDTPKTLSELGLTPSATLISSSTNTITNTTTSGTGGGVVSAGGALLRGAVGVAGSFFGSFVGNGGPPPPQGSGEEDSERRTRPT